MTYEYETTVGESVPLQQGRADAPRQPEGDGWELIGSDVSQNGLHDFGGNGERNFTTPTHLRTRFIHFWYWRRRTDDKPCPKCQSLAKKDGRCINCKEK